MTDMTDAARRWADSIDADGPPLGSYNCLTLTKLLRDLALTIDRHDLDMKEHDEQLVVALSETVVGAMRESMAEAIAEAEVNGYKRQIDERLAAALVQASYKPVVPGLMGDLI